MKQEVVRKAEMQQSVKSISNDFYVNSKMYLKELINIQCKENE